MTNHSEPATVLSAEVSCYVKIADHTIYLEVSAATGGVPLVSYWTDEYAEDTATNMIGSI
tara:strand:- start:856 stop:1035 length:180 start_codon:yes stop_codon:yes gene_type:complete